MKSFTEAGLALIAVLALGGAFWWYSGGPVDDESTSPAPTVELDSEAVARGMNLATAKGCAACHSTDGTPLVGPTWKGLAGSSRPLESGESVIADGAYLIASILDPSVQIVAGFSDVMPGDYSDQLTETEVEDLVSFIQSLAD